MLLLLMKVESVFPAIELFEFFDEMIESFLKTRENYLSSDKQSDIIWCALQSDGRKGLLGFKTS